jgi:hypothetical protein
MKGLGEGQFGRFVNMIGYCLIFTEYIQPSRQITSILPSNLCIKETSKKMNGWHRKGLEGVILFL